jgi:hypothetical protein
MQQDYGIILHLMRSFEKALCEPHGYPQAGKPMWPASYIRKSRPGATRTSAVENFKLPQNVLK